MKRPLFLTAAQAEVPAVPEIQPAIPIVQLLPLIKLMRSLISGMLSLSFFGDSAIGATVPGTIYDLTPQAARARAKFATFFQDAQHNMQTESYKLSKAYNVLESRWNSLQDSNRRLHAMIRSFEKHINRIQQGSIVNEVAQLNSEMKAVSGNSQDGDLSVAGFTSGKARDSTGK
jgi:hypothetical protein